MIDLFIYLFIDLTTLLSGLIHGRLLVSAWEDGIEGCEDDAVTLTMVAVQHFLKNIITSVLVSRNPWRSREGAKHSIGKENRGVHRELSIV